jgi:hypothetical protein
MHDTCVKEVAVVSSIWKKRRVTCGVESLRSDINLFIITIIIIILFMNFERTTWCVFLYEFWSFHCYVAEVPFLQLYDAV